MSIRPHFLFFIDSPKISKKKSILIKHDFKTCLLKNCYNKNICVHTQLVSYSMTTIINFPHIHRLVMLFKEFWVC